MADPTFNKLKGANAPAYLKDFQKGAINSIHMLSMSFNGILDGFQHDGETIKKNAEQIAECFAGIEQCENLCAALDNKINEESQKLLALIDEQKKQLAKQRKELTDKLNKEVQSLNSKIDNVRTDCMDAVEKLENKVGESLQNIEKLQNDFVELQAEVNDNIRSLSDRVSTNTAAIAEQENKFKKQLQELTKILHQKALELDEKIEAGLKKTKEQIDAFNKKLQEFTFQFNQELSKKADITDLQRKLNIEQFDKFYNEQTSNNQILKNNIDLLEKKLAECNKKNETLEETILQLKTENTKTKQEFQDKLQQLENELKKNQLDEIQAMMQEMIVQEVDEANAALREELIGLMQQVADSSAAKNEPPPSIGTSSGMCIACGRGPPTNSFSPLPVRSPSPSKKPVHGGGFNRLSRKLSDAGALPKSDSGKNSKPGTPKSLRRLQATKPGSPAKVEVETQAVEIVE